MGLIRITRYGYVYEKEASLVSCFLGGCSPRYAGPPVCSSPLDPHLGFGVNGLESSIITRN